MSEAPQIPQKAPYVLDLEPGTYHWCQCGRSGNQPWCDGSHTGTSFTPLEMEITETKKVALCGCKHSGNKPLCDGSHKDL